MKKYAIDIWTTFDSEFVRNRQKCDFSMFIEDDRQMTRLRLFNSFEDALKCLKDEGERWLKHDPETKVEIDEKAGTSVITPENDVFFKRKIVELEMI